MFPRLDDGIDDFPRNIGREECFARPAPRGFGAPESLEELPDLLGADTGNFCETVKKNGIVHREIEWGMGNEEWGIVFFLHSSAEYRGGVSVWQGSDIFDFLLTKTEEEEQMRICGSKEAFQ